MCQQMDEQGIISKILLGNKELFTELVERYKYFVFTIALKFTDDRQNAEDIAQDVFIKAYKSLADFQHKAKFSTWLYVITVNTCKTALHKKKLLTYSLSDESVLEKAGSVNAVENNISNKSMSEMVNEALSLLSSEDSIVITLFYKADQTLEEIGHIMAITPNNAKVKLHRARLRLKKILELHFKQDIDLLN